MNKDVLIIILSYLDQESIAEARLINRHINHAVTDERLWNSLCDRDYPEQYKLIKQATLYKTYKLCYGLDNLRWTDGRYCKRSMVNIYNSVSFVHNGGRGPTLRFPSVICQLENLRELSFFNDHIKEIPDEINYLTNLRRLTVRHVDLNCIPDMRKLINLTCLDFGDNMISIFPKGVCQLTNLQTLILQSNVIEEIPKEICKLTDLTTLDLGRNRIHSLPKEMNRLISVKYIDLSYNMLTRIPKIVRKLDGLNHISLKGNPFKVRIDL